MATDFAPQDQAWRPAFRRYCRRFLPFGAALGFLSGAAGADKLLSLGALTLGILDAGLVVILMSGSIAVYTSLRHWRSHSRLNHYVTWISIVAAAVIPMSVAIRLLFKAGAPENTDISFGSGPVFVLGIVLTGVVLGSVANSLEAAILRAERDITARRGPDQPSNGAV